VGEGIKLSSVEQLETKDAKVVFQGMKGAYSYTAMHTFFGEKVNSRHVETFRDAMECLKKGDATYAVLPIENSSAGIVNDIFDLLAEYDNYIVGEVIVPVRHVLLGVKGANISDIKKVYSHPQALMQCKNFLDEHREWEKIPYLNTAVAAAMISQEQDKTKAAIASEMAGECYDLDVIADEIYYSENNSTRFIIVTNQKIFLKDASRISICFEGIHKAGSLYNLLSHLIYNGLSMTKIESRPIEGKDFEYHFFIDIEGNLEDSSVLNALSGLSYEAKNLKILGNY
ncbi:MAG TPA: prephenate dehydratase, partial [Candidatus Merdenecus merdavium]|nr:prephenate dehydratase [Candidatus Merdenecus merdavium]